MNKHHHPDETPDVSHIANPDVHHEERDVNVRVLFLSVVALAIISALVLIGVRGLYKIYDAREEALELPPASRVNLGQRKLPPLPRLQGAPGSDELPLEEMKRYQQEEAAIVNSYGVVDQSSGVYRIPIEEAKKLLIQRGWSAAPTPAATPAAKAAAAAGTAPARVGN